MCGGSNLSTVLLLWGIYIKKCISLVRICRETRNARNASTKFRKTSESKKAEKSLETSAFLVFSCLHLNQTLIMAAEEGFEPSQTESESVVLPLHNSAINSTLTIIAHAVRFVNSFFAIFDFYLKILCRNAEKGCLKAHSESLTAPGKPAELLPFTAGESRCAAVGSLCQLTDNSVKKRSHFFR